MLCLLFAFSAAAQNNEASIEQLGTLNEGLVIQQGNESSVQLSQDGLHNAHIEQKETGHSVTLMHNSGFITVSISIAGNSNATTITRN